jgi:hypothetical protein
LHFYNVNAQSSDWLRINLSRWSYYLRYASYPLLLSDEYLQHHLVRYYSVVTALRLGELIFLVKVRFPPEGSRFALGCPNSSFKERVNHHRVGADVRPIKQYGCRC